ncbi:YibE/F family protein [Microlunatus ginsengisoli]|uniref:YibE/F-like protein n=1 Tax=Microlunatus ginsengisoli TaxID=363863 RepID=A0ABP7A163_9ACTN
MTHTHIDDTELSAADLARHRRALRIMVIALIPLAIWTAVGLIALWPHDVRSHINSDVSGYNVAGVTYPTGRVTAIQPIACDGLAGSTPDKSSAGCANIAVEVLQGEDQGKKVEGIPLTAPIVSSGLEIGQKVVLIRIPPADGQPAQYQFSDFERRSPLAVIAILFAIAVISVARWRGFAALLGLAFAGFIMIKFMFPALVIGTNPIAVGLIGSSAIMFVALYAAHGFSARTTTALLGTLFGLVMVAALGWLATRWAHLTGVSSEDDYVLSAAAPDLQLTSVVVCGIIVAGLGVLNDVTITQASAVWELADTDPDQRRLFSRAMRIGRDHIASTVYTIAFATAGAVLPVLLLIAIYDRPLLQVIQTEQFAAEVIRTLVGSIGLVLAVPLTTAIGVAVVRVSGAHRNRASASASTRRRTAAATRPTAARPAEAEPSATTTEEESAADIGDDLEPVETGDADGAASAAGDDRGAAAAEVETGTDAGVADEPAGVVDDVDRRPSDEAADDEAADDDGSAADAVAAEEAPARRRGRFRFGRRSGDDDDFGDFSDLRDPVDGAGPPERR